MISMVMVKGFAVLFLRFLFPNEIEKLLYLFLTNLPLADNCVKECHYIYKANSFNYLYGQKIIELNKCYWKPPR